MATLLAAQSTWLHELGAIVIFKLRALHEGGLARATDEMPCPILRFLLKCPRILGEVALVDIVLVL